jgi:PTS system cellobiose-specific IIB component
MKKIVMLCCIGMSTNLLVNKMKEAAKEEGFECEIEAYPVSESSNVGKDADIVLLGPQVRYNLSHVQKQFPDKPVEAIDMVAYGMMDGKKVIAQVKKALGL